MGNPACPFATQRLLARAMDKPMIVPTATAAHTAVSGATGQELGDYFEHADADSHFYVDRDGGLWQYLPVNRKSWAQYAGNDHAVSYETWDGGNVDTPWNHLQVETIVRLLQWLHDDWGVSIAWATDPQGPGVAYHSRFPSWNTDAHQCPGSVRVSQLTRDVVPALVDNSTPPEDDMTRPIAATPSWCARQSDGAYPRFQATPDDAGNAVVVSIDNAPFTPSWSSGTHGAFDDFAYAGLWCRKFHGAGNPTGFGEAHGAFFLITEHGTYDVAHA